MLRMDQIEFTGNMGQIPPVSKFFVSILFHFLLIRSAGERFWPKLLMNWLTKLDVRLKVVIICSLLKGLAIN